ncbi:MAG TPA: hypothetical protein VK590_02935 [Saprospiraceae bacterium]|nr:hypothetical protein [Saprospiraceae bacterium]
MKTKLRIVSFLLVSLIFSTNMVLSIESIYCICFKTTKYILVNPNSVCCKSHTRSNNSVHSCCNVSMKKMPCKASSIITINSKTDFTKSKLFKPLFSDIQLLTYGTNSIDVFLYPVKSIRIYYADPSPPGYLLSHPFLQSFLC